MYICIYMCVYMYVLMYACMHTCMHAYIHKSILCGVNVTLCCFGLGLGLVSSRLVSSRLVLSCLVLQLVLKLVLSWPRLLLSSLVSSCPLPGAFGSPPGPWALRAAGCGLPLIAAAAAVRSRPCSCVRAEPKLLDASGG